MLLGGPPTSENIKDEVYRLIDEGCRKVVVDIKEVSRMNSSGLGILISALTSLKNKWGDLKLSGVDETIEGALVMTKLNTLFDMHDTPEQAAESF